MKNKLAFALDVIFVGGISFVISLVVFNYFIPYPFCIIYSACLATLSTILYFALNGKHQKTARYKKDEQRKIDELISELSFSTIQEQNAILERGLINAKISYEKRRGGLYLKDKKSLALCKFSFNKVTKADIVKAFNMITKTQTAYIIAQGFDCDIISFAERFNGRIKLTDGAKLYSFLKEKEALPKEYKYKNLLESKKKINFKNLLDKRKSKTFFTFGALFLLFSYISPLKTYYIVCGCIFLIYSLVLRLFGINLKISSPTADNI